MADARRKTRNSASGPSGSKGDIALPRFSFEFFPPATPAAEARFHEAATKLAALAPDFVSVTYGAGGTTQERTFKAIDWVRQGTELEPAAHLTCVGASRAQIDAIAEQYWEAGIRRIVALRGDAPQGSQGYVPHPEGYAYAADLVAGLKRVADFDISVSAYPEVHPEARDAAADLDNLKRKIDAGASRAITQFFFDPDDYLRFLDRARAAGITAPIVPGILPIVNFERTRQMAESCKAAMPQWLIDLYGDLEEDTAVRFPVAVSVAADLCRYLAARGVEDFHIYTLNRADLTGALCRLLRNDARSGQFQNEQPKLLAGGLS
ncbi:methylenetetrahydrofolate reductase [NAD(P)H] [Pelagibius marinus]|uniref:methylenetetrahydrofolate reductase [NAD(P)H] n=1 Tax=Pelagibius marinus TaxID=2762760 RepID=UPI0018733B6A|nr:methylenetetrahydrofolate reductase [NAD(P)H] [Pelagibius marinus]